MKRFLILHVFGSLLVTMAQGATSFELAAKATNELGVDLHRQLATGDENLCISPYSIDSALAMTFAGADGQTRSEMARVLHFPNGDDVPASFSELQQSLEQMSATTAELAKESKKFGGPSEPITLNIANRLFAQKGYHFREAYLSLVKQNFGGAFEPLDFVADPAAATQRINKWGLRPDARSNSRFDSRRRAGQDNSTRPGKHALPESAVGEWVFTECDTTRAVLCSRRSCRCSDDAKNYEFRLRKTRRIHCRQRSLRGQRATICRSPSCRH